MKPHSDLELLDALTAIVSQAARAVLDLRSPTIPTHLKTDHSPVTEADFAAQRIVLDGLARLLPDLPVVSEEALPPAGPTPLRGRFALLDPLDGTKEFVAGRDEFSINLALVEAGTPVLGIVYAPARGVMWRGLAPAFADRLQLAPGAPPDEATERVPIHTRRRPVTGLTAVTSRSHLDPDTEAFLQRLPAAQRITYGSALKFGLVADGTADIYPRLSRTSEWDIAAGHAVIAAAGGSVVAASGETLLYGRREREFRVPGFIAYGDPSFAANG